MSGLIGSAIVRGFRLTQADHDELIELLKQYSYSTNPALALDFEAWYEDAENLLDDVLNEIGITTADVVGNTHEFIGLLVEAGSDSSDVSYELEHDHIHRLCTDPYEIRGEWLSVVNKIVDEVLPNAEREGRRLLAGPVKAVVAWVETRSFGNGCFGWHVVNHWEF